MFMMSFLHFGWNAILFTRKRHFYYDFDFENFIQFYKNDKQIRWNKFEVIFYNNPNHVNLLEIMRTRYSLIFDIFPFIIRMVSFGVANLILLIVRSTVWAAILNLFAVKMGKSKRNFNWTSIELMRLWFNLWYNLYLIDTIYTQIDLKITFPNIINGKCNEVKGHHSSSVESFLVI